MEIHFDEELKTLKQKLLWMADTAHGMIDTAIKAISLRDAMLIDKVLLTEKKVNQMEIEIEDEAIRLLALRQPIARDLRLLVALLKINNNLERIADQACNISETAVYLLQEPPLNLPLVDIPQMASFVQKMVKDSIDAFVQHDARQAQAVCEHDDQIDWMNDQIFRVLLTHMMENPRVITRAVDLILVSRNLERIADHATNISEEVIFIEEGKNVKHHLLEDPTPAQP
jgi:phosphate transport system protein